MCHAGADVHALSSDGTKSLHVAAMYERTEVIRVLVHMCAQLVQTSGPGVLVGEL
jgi:hypothetical protein